MFAKRAKGSNSATPSKDALKKPSSFILTNKSILSTPVPAIRGLASPTRPASTPRRTLQPRSPVAKLNTSITRNATPTSAPAGRSPTRGRRSGILSSRRRTSAPFSRVDPPSFSLDNAAPFSLDAALKGTIPSYNRPKAAARNVLSAIDEPEGKASWFFDIHEDTPEQEMTNLLQHSTCVLDISSDEESEQKARRENEEGRDKENIPPADDVSQTSARNAPRLGADDMVVEKERVALGEMNTADFYPTGCDESSIILVPGDEEEEPVQPLEAEETQQPEQPEPAAIVSDFEFAPEPEAVESAPVDIDMLMSKTDSGSSKAAVLQPMEGTGESFDLWESGSVKDESETAIAAEVPAEASS